MTAGKDVSGQRTAAIGDVMARIKALVAERGMNRDTLDGIATELKGLAAHGEWFTAEEFPSAPVDVPPGTPNTRYLLSMEPDQSFALYLNSLNPGKNSSVHNHNTWAVIVGLDGQELNRVYRRRDDGSNPGHADLEVAREIVVEPGGEHAAFLGEDIHSIHVRGTRSTRQFHLYGRALETLTDRLAFDLKTGEVVNYNKTHFKPGRDAR